MGDTVCCAVFTIDIQVPNSRWLELELDTELGDTSCFDWECTRFRSNIALPNAGGIWPLELEVVMDGSHVKIQVIGSAYPDGFPLGSVIQITLCPKWGAPEILCWE